MFDVGKLTIQARVGARHVTNANGVAERSGGQQLDAQLVGDHVGEVQTQLGIAVQRCAAAGDRAKSCMFDRAAVLTRINRNRTRTNNDVPRLVGVGERGSDGQGQGGGNE